MKTGEDIELKKTISNHDIIVQIDNLICELHTVDNKKDDRFLWRFIKLEYSVFIKPSKIEEYLLNCRTCIEQLFLVERRYRDNREKIDLWFKEAVSPTQVFVFPDDEFKQVLQQVEILNYVVSTITDIRFAFEYEKKGISDFRDFYSKYASIVQGLEEWNKMENAIFSPNTNSCNYRGMLQFKVDTIQDVKLPWGLQKGKAICSMFSELRDFGLLHFENSLVFEVKDGSEQNKKFKRLQKQSKEIEETLRTFNFEEVHLSIITDIDNILKKSKSHVDWIIARDSITDGTKNESSEHFKKIEEVIREIDVIIEYLKVEVG